ncbi:MAG: 4Fe-4S ferredoxin [Bacteroidetes bacterium HGW-Bacteroidetes-17]|nr:MAG: 4Fe-4S ferredoxin [Bacteroidetes bacterium HGW-Bacteroidetes-17]
MKNSYQELADLLDQIPNGYPKTKSGIELKILAKLFTEEEARLATSLSLIPQSISEIAIKTSSDEALVKSGLITMVKKGLIELRREEGKGLVFFLMPFVVGFYERQNAKIDKEFAQFFEEYYHEAFHHVMMVDPSVHRVIPVEKTIPVNIDVMPYEKASTYLNEANSWGVLNCICRVQKKLIGQGCDHPIENCLVFSSKVGAFDRTDDIRSLTKEEALQILDEADKAGLVHSTNNAQHDVTYICNCCTCACGVLRGITEHGSLSAIARSDFYAVVDPDLCNGCEVCIDRCQFNALSMEDGISKVNTTFCFGCGLCVTTCSSGALSLVQKDADNLKIPPISEKDWREKRTAARLNL